MRYSYCCTLQQADHTYIPRKPLADPLEPGDLRLEVVELELVDAWRPK
jgi:hypothetical protein